MHTATHSQYIYIYIVIIISDNIISAAVVLNDAIKLFYDDGLDVGGAILCITGALSNVEVLDVQIVH